MENKYIIKFNNVIPTLDSLKFENSGTNTSYPNITIIMDVYEKDKLDLIYSINLKIKGHYYCCGSHNFEYENNDIERTIIKDCNNTILNDIYDELNNNYTNIINNTILDIENDVVRIFEYLCQY
jgi:hypothetical protein